MKRKIITLTGCVLLLLIQACKKDISHSSATTKKISSLTSIPDGYTMTSVGLLPDSNITVIEKGYKLSFINGHAYKVHLASGNIVKDFGEVMPNIYNRRAVSNLMGPHSRNFNPSTADLIFGNSGQTNNWITYAQWQNTTANPITNFTTNFIVPNAPTSNSNQLFAIWTGLEPTNQTYPLIQPLLIWGYSGVSIGGGQSWTLVSYIIWPNANGQFLAAISPPVHNVAPGTALQAQISCTGQQPDGSYNCTSQFVGYTRLDITENAQLNLNGGGTAPAPFIPALNYACEVLEIPVGEPYITSVNEYPGNQLDISMNSINITTGSTNPTINWQSSSANNLPNGAALGEHTDVINNTEVDLYFQPEPPPVFSYWTPDAFTVNTPITTLTPSISGTTPTGYTVSPALPPGLSLNPTTGAITGTATAITPATNYTISATNASGAIGTFTLNLAIVNGAFTFLVSTNDTQSIYFNLAVNGGPSTGTYRVGQGQSSYSITTPCTLLSNSTVVMAIQEAGGIMPSGATLYNLGAPIQGVISGNTITFTGVNLNAGTSCQIVAD